MKYHVAKTSKKNLPRQRGVALLLVLIAVGVAFILALSFMNAQSTNAGIARNVQNQTNARQIAESAILLAVNEIKTNPSYRDVHPNGIWVNNKAMFGGTYTIIGMDGVDEDGDGIVDGDGDLADDANDPITLTAVATYEGASHTARVIIEDSRLISVNTMSVLDKVELKDDTILDSWNSNLGSYAATQGSNAIVSTNSIKKDTIKIKDDAEIRGDVFVGPNGNPNQVVKVDNQAVLTGTKDVLVKRDLIPGVEMPTTLGASTGDFSLSSSQTLSTNLHVEKFKLEGNAILTIQGHVIIWAEGDVEIKGNAQIKINDNSSLKFYTGDKKKKLKIQDNAQINVNSEKPNRLTFYRSSREKVEIKDNAQVYGTFIAPASELKLKDAAQLFGASKSKKVKLEKDSRFHLDLAPKFADAKDVFIDQGGSDFGIAAEDSIEIKDKAKILALGSVTPRLSTNSTLADKILLKNNAVVTGDLYVGPTGNPSTVIKYSGGTLIGTENVLAHSVDILSIDEPIMPASTGDRTFSTGKTTITTDQHWNKLEIKSTAILEIDGNLNIMVDGDFKMSNTAQIQIKGNGTLNLYLKGIIEFKDDAVINTDKAAPKKVNIFIVNDTGSTREVVFDGDTIAYANLLAPNVFLTMKSKTKWFGNIRCENFIMEGDAEAHVPEGIGDGQGINGRINELFVQWVELR